MVVHDGATPAALVNTLSDEWKAAKGITLLATSLASFAYRVSFPKVDSPPTIEPFAPMSALPVPVLNAQTPLTLFALLLVPLLAWVLYRTPLGLAIRMVGENPAAAEGQGLSVVRLRSGAVMAGSALMGVAGAFLTLSAFNAFYFNMVNGRGWVCVALVVFASWRPGKALLGALLFGFFDALQLRLQEGRGVVPYQFYLMLPYLMAIVALVVVARRGVSSSADEAVSQGREMKRGRKARAQRAMPRLQRMPFGRHAASTRHIRLTSHPGQGAGGAPPINWGAADALERGPIVGTTTNRSQRNVIGTHSGSYGVYRALAVAAGSLTRGHRADLTNTSPTDPIGPYPQWGDPDKIVSIDPWGAIGRRRVRRLHRAGLRHPPDDRGDQGAHRPARDQQAIAFQRLKPDGRILLDDGSAVVTKAAIEPVWWLPGVAKRFACSEAELRRALFEETGGMYPELVTRSDLERVPAADRRADALHLRRPARPRRPERHADRARARRVQRLRRVRLRHLHLPAVPDARDRGVHPRRAGGRRRPRSSTAARKAARSAR